MLELNHSKTAFVSAHSFVLETVCRIVEGKTMMMKRCLCFSKKRRLNDRNINGY